MASLSLSVEEGVGSLRASARRLRQCWAGRAPGDRLRAIWGMTCALAGSWTFGQINFRIDPRAFRAALLGNDYAERPITGEQALAASALPALHQDPFDRMLVQGVTLLTADPIVRRYSGAIRLER